MKPFIERDQPDSIVLVTGGCGFIGSNLVEYFLGKGNRRIRILDNLSTGRKEYISNILNSSGLESPQNLVELIEGDVRNEEQVEEAMEGVSSVVHLAAHTSVVDSLHDPKQDFQVNAQGTLNLLEACRSRGVGQFVYASSNAVVGEQEPPIDERKVPSPMSPYGSSKLAGEALCSAFYSSFGMEAVSLRFANVYGPHSDHKPSVVAEFIRQAKGGEPLIIYGDGNQTRDFIHAQDICRAIELALNCNVKNSRDSVFQIATGLETKIIDLAKMISDVAVKSGLTPPEIVFEEPRAGEIRRNYANIEKARNLLGFQPVVELREGLRWTWEGACASP